MKIALLNVKFSPNLGDGLLSECLERELALALPDAELVAIDLAGRSAYRSHHRSRRGGVIVVLEALPRWVRGYAVRVALALLVRFRLRRHVRERLVGCHAVVVGGGNLLADSDLNFPMKLAGALGEVAQARLPVAVHAVGVNRKWSRAGQKLFIRALGGSSSRGSPDHGSSMHGRDLVAATVRDERSQQAWRELLEPHGLPAAGLAGDPGLLARNHYVPRPHRLRQPGGPHVAGLCITSPLAVRYHAGSSAPTVDQRVWYHRAIQGLTDAGLHVVLFTNGSPEDRAFLDRHGARWCSDTLGATAGDTMGDGAGRTARATATIAPGFATPSDLVDCITGCDVVIAHRMHACILAHAFAIPAIGLKWDVKLESFFALAGREGFIADCADLDPETLAALTRQALATGVDRERLDRLVAATRADVALLASRIAHITRHRPAPQ